MMRTRSRATSFDVAALAGVSQSAVSRAFNPGSSIAASTRQKVLEAALKLNYVPNSIASSLTTKRTNIVALILGDLANPFYVNVLHAFSQRLQQEGRQVLTFTVEQGLDADGAMQRVLQYQVDGVILTAARLSTRMTGIIHDRGIPIVLFNRYVPGSDASCVRCDNTAGGRLMAEAFLSAGARRFSIIGGDPVATTSQDRIRGFVDRLLQAGFPHAAIEEMPGGSSYEGGARAAMRLFHRRTEPRPDALFCVNDIMAMGAMDVLKHRIGLSIPDDLMVGSFDDIAEARRLPYQLTTVRQPLDAMVEETLRMLHLDDPYRPIERGIDKAIPGRLVWRKTIPTQSAPIGEGGSLRRT